MSEVYDVSEIKHIDSEIYKAIRKYVSDGCSALGIDIPESITSAQIEELVKQLDDEIKAFDVAESLLQQDPEYAEKRKQYENLQKQIESLQKRRGKLTEDEKAFSENNKLIHIKIQNFQEADRERTEWLQQRELEKNSALQELETLTEHWNNEKDIRLPAKYAHKMAAVYDLLYGVRKSEDDEFARFLDNYCDQMRSELEETAGNKTVEKILELQAKKQEDISKRANQLDTQIAEISNQIYEYAEWLRIRSNAAEGEKTKRTLLRSEMERARYFLSRIESTVFEREVWNAIVPLKEKYNVKTLQIEKLEGGHQKETRILYKSDLLFYLKIYAYLNPDVILPDYRLICIDEGQDLHKADYDMLHQLYPNAALDIFGDVGQVLHTDCGINEWKTDTGVDKEYILDRNYRNNAAIVEFCNSKFGSEMQFVGSVQNYHTPHILTSIEELKSALNESEIVMIVKDRIAFENFCNRMGMDFSDFEYLDTKSEKESSDKLRCYTIFAAKGLEFKNVIVYASEMTKNQKIVACTRAMEELYYYA